MAGKRRAYGRKKSRRNFKSKSGSHRKNFSGAGPSMRGGIRL